MTAPRTAPDGRDKPQPEHRAYFLATAREFRDAIERPAFWALPKPTRERALSALALVYGGLGSDPDTFVATGRDDNVVDELATVFASCVTDYKLRAASLELTP